MTSNGDRGPRGDRARPSARALGGFDPTATYSAAAEEYERASRRYWAFLSSRTIERLDLRPGQSVLDAACGTAPATVAAAERVGSGGRVVGADTATGMLDVARRRVAASGIGGIELVQGDMLALPFDEEFDVVLCVLGIFFVDDMSAAARALWSYVRPGGTLAVTTFGKDVWVPVLEHFVESAARARPDIERILPWRRTEKPEALARALSGGGVENLRMAQETEQISFAVEDWRSIVMGSGLRRIAIDLGDAADDVLAETERWARAEGLSTVRVSALYATAEKSPT